MSKNELVAKIEALNEWEALMEEARAEAEAIRDSIKAEMLEREVDRIPDAGQRHHPKPQNQHTLANSLTFNCLFLKAG